MQIKLLKFIPVAFLFLVTSCSLFSDKIDDAKVGTPAKLYSDAREELSYGNYERAIKHFEKLESSYPFGVYAQQAQMEIAYAYYRQSDQPQALAAVERFIKLHPNHPNVDYMYYLRGLINFNDKVGVLDFLVRQDPTERDPKAMREAFDAFKQLAERFPDSVYTRDAYARMKYLISAMAQYEVHVANYYYRRGAFLAAANRAQTAVKAYQTAPAVEEALYIMVRAYDELGLPDLRDDASRVLKKNFPDSKYFSGGYANKKSWWKFW